MTFTIKEVPDIQRFMWKNPDEIEPGIVWDGREYPLDMRVDFKGKDNTGRVVLVEAKNKAGKSHVYQVLAQKYRYLYAHIGEDFRNLLVCYRANPEAKALAKKTDIEVIELGEPLLIDVLADYTTFKGFLSRRQYDAFLHLFLNRSSVTETARKMGISKARVSTLKKEINTRTRQHFDELMNFVRIMKQAPEVFQEDLDEIAQVI